MNQIKKNFQTGNIDKPTFINEMFASHQQLFEYVSLMKDTDIKKIEINDEGVLFTSRENETKLFCTKNDKRTAPFEILNFDKYEAQDADLMYGLIKDGDTIFDIGANIGWYSINFSKKFPTAKIYSFEPIPDTYAQLVQNVAINNASTIQYFNFGFSDETKVLSFYVSELTSVSSSAQNLTDDKNIKLIECKVIPIDNFIKEKPVTIDFIKCDVEGAELFVYKGAVETLKTHQPIVFTEMLRKWSAKYNYHPNDIIALFKELNYKCFIATTQNKLKEVILVDETTLETNFVFLHTTKHNDILKKYEA
jgi:FkbM family methyltransferase